MMTVLDLQKRYRELGRLRAGEKGEKGQPKKRDTFRVTSPAKELIERVAEVYGGKVKEWEDAPTQGKQWECSITAESIDVLVPPQDLVSNQWYELWSGGGAQRRCDSQTELISGRPCLCDPENRECSITTHLLVMLPQIPDIGVWRVTSHSFYAATELPGTVELLMRAYQRGEVPQAKLAIEIRTSKRKNQTRHFPVVVLRLPWALADPDRPAQLLRPVERPELPAERAVLPDDASFRSDTHPGWGEPPALPSTGAAEPVQATETGASLTEDNTQGSARPDPAPVAPEPITKRQNSALQAACKEAGMDDRKDRLAWASEELGRPVTSYKSLTRVEARTLLDALSVADPDADEPPPPAEEPPKPPPPPKFNRGEILTRGAQHFGGPHSFRRAVFEQTGKNMKEATDEELAKVLADKVSG
jgi:hypothetical protein